MSVKTGFLRRAVRPTIIVTLALVIVAVGFGVVGQLITQTTLSSAGIVKAVGVRVYCDANCANPVASIEWGVIEPGAQINQTVYIKNGGNTPVTLNLATQNWTPEGALNYLNLIWNYDGQTVDPDVVVKVTMTLNVSPSIEGITSFDFEIVIVGIG